MSAVVQAEGLTKFYGAQRGLEDLTLAVEAREVFGVRSGTAQRIRWLVCRIEPDGARRPTVHVW